MGGSSSQTVGYKYFAGLQVVIGNCIEYMININPDNRGWIFTKPDEIAQLKTGDTSIAVNKPNIFGGDKQEGGWVGTIDIHTGKPENLRQNEYLAEHDSNLVSSFPYLSYVVFKGFTIDKGFQLVSMSGMLKDVLYWPKRIHIKDDGSPQWYDVKSEVPETYEFHGGGGRQGDFSRFIKAYINEQLFESRLIQVKMEKNEGEEIFYTDTFGVTSTTSGEVPSNEIRKISYYLEGGLTGLFIIEANVLIYGHSFKLDVLGEVGLIERTEENITNGKSVYLKYLVDATQSKLGIYVEVSQPWHANPNDPTGFILGGAIKNIIYTNVGEVWDYKEPSGDINPIHKIREIITGGTAMNKPESMINDENFRFAANRIWDEELGVSGAFTEKSSKEAIDELLYHIEAGARLNRQTGQYEIVLFRDDLLDLDNAQTFDKSNIKTFNIELANIDDVINSVNVNFYDRQNIKDSSFSLDEIGSIMSSELDATTLDFPYYMRRKNAELVGNWKLKQLSTPTRKGTFTTGKYEARKINKYDVVKLTWQNQNMIEVPVRIMKIGLGDGRDNTVTLDWVEVIPYSSITFPKINVNPPTSVVLPPQPNQSIAFEMPYLEAVQRFGQTQVDAELANNPDLGYLVVATKKPQNNSINALLYTDDGTGYQQASIVDYCPVAILDQEISYLDASFSVKNVASINQAEFGTLILCDEELMVYQSYDSSTKILTVKRAALDTVPKPHSQDAVFYFYDAFNAFDSEQYVLSEVIKAKVLTTTPSGVLDILEAGELPLEMNARAIRPYPPANVKINGKYWPTYFEDDLVITWVDRNRLQQTGGSILGWFDGGVTLEPDTQTMLTITEYDANNIELSTQSANVTEVNTFTLLESGMSAGVRKIEITLKTVRDGYECLNPFTHSILISNLIAPSNVAFEVIEL